MRDWQRTWSRQAGIHLQPGWDQGDQKAERSSWQNCTDRILQNMVSSKQQRMEWRRAHKSPNLILPYNVPSCTHMYLRILTMYLWFVLSQYARSLGASNPPGNNPLSGPMCGWLCWELIIPWKCYQPYDMYSSYSILNKELTSCRAQSLLLIQVFIDKKQNLKFMIL